MSEFRNRTYILIAACLVAMLALKAGPAAAGVSGSKHDLSASGGSQFSNKTLAGGAIINEVCVFCHTPHAASSESGNPNLTNTLLWNRTNDTTNLTYYMYSGGSGSVTIDSKPKGITLMCMSCHDGITAIYSILNAPGGNTTASTTDPLSDQLLDVFPDWLTNSEGPNIGAYSPDGGWTWSETEVDLSNDHPVSFNWVSSIPGINDPNPVSGAWTAAPSNGKIRLFNGRMECATCHDVHNNTIEPFLRISNQNSDMCLTCHAK